jgi:hypothetical protein
MKSPDDRSDEQMDGTDQMDTDQMDDMDFAILDGIRAIFEEVDPMPADLPERIRFSLAMRGLETEVARLVAEDDSRLVAARGMEQSRTVTFDSASLTIMIRIDSNKNGTVRIDGWLAPSQRREIEMQTSLDTLSVSSDDQGRFAFADVPQGAARLVVRAAGHDQGGGGSSVMTPGLVL